MNGTDEIVDRVTRYARLPFSTLIAGGLFYLLDKLIRINESALSQIINKLDAIQKTLDHLPGVFK